MEQFPLKSYAIFKNVSLQLILILTLFPIYLYSQSNQLLKIEYKVNIPQTINIDCNANLVYSLDSFFVFHIGNEGCDSIIYQCVNGNTNSIVWTIFGPQYGGTRFYKDSYYFMRSGVLFCSSIYTGKVKWFKVIESNHEYFFIKEISENEIILSGKLKLGNEYYNEVFKVDLNGNYTKRQKILMGEQYILLGQKKNLNVLTCCDSAIPLSPNNLSKNENGKMIVRAFIPPISYSQFYSINADNDTIYLHCKLHNYKSKITIDSIYSYCTSNSSLQLVYNNKRLSDDYDNHLYLGNGFLLYPQLDSMAYEEKKIKQSLLLINLRSNSILWKFKIPDKIYKHNYIRDIEIYHDSILVFLIADKILYVLKMETGKLLWKYRLKSYGSDLFVTKAFLVVTSYKNFRKLKPVILSKQNPGQKPIIINKFPVYVDHVLDYIYLINKSNTVIYKARIEPRIKQ